MATIAQPTDQTVIEFDVRTDEMLVNMGPQHPSTHGVLRLVLRQQARLILLGSAAGLALAFALGGVL